MSIINMLDLIKADEKFQDKEFNVIMINTNTYSELKQIVNFPSRSGKTRFQNIQYLTDDNLKDYQYRFAKKASKIESNAKLVSKWKIEINGVELKHTLAQAIELLYKPMYLNAKVNGYDKNGVKILGQSREDFLKMFEVANKNES